MIRIKVLGGLYTGLYGDRLGLVGILEGHTGMRRVMQGYMGFGGPWAIVAGAYRDVV